MLSESRPTFGDKMATAEKFTEQAMCLQVVCIKGGAQLFEDAEIGLCCYEADMDDYVPMACSLHADAFGGLLVTVVSCTSCSQLQIEWLSVSSP